MTIYKITLVDGQTFRMCADLSQASAPISADFFGDDEWQGWPYQTADAGHTALNAAKLLSEYFSTGDDDCTDVASVVAIGGDDR